MTRHELLQLTLCVQAGLDPVDLWTAVRQSAIGRARTLDLVAKQHLKSSCDPSFTLCLAYKDFNLAMDLARELDVPMKQAEAAHEDYTEALERGWSERHRAHCDVVQTERVDGPFNARDEDVRNMLARD